MNTATSLDEISIRLDQRRARIRAGLENHSQESVICPGGMHPVLSALIGRALQMVRQYSHASSAPGSMLRFAATHPLLIAVTTAAVIVTGPARVAGFIAKAAAAWRFVSMLRSQ